MNDVIKIALLGSGTVGGGVIQILEKNGSEIAQKVGKSVRITKILVRNPEKYKDLLKAKNADKFDIRQVAMKLQNVYYNLTLLNVDKNAEYEAIQKELESLSE